MTGEARRTPLTRLAPVPVPHSWPRRTPLAPLLGPADLLETDGERADGLAIFPAQLPRQALRPPIDLDGTEIDRAIQGSHPLGTGLHCPWKGLRDPTRGDLDERIG